MIHFCHASSEASAIASLRAVNSAQVGYAYSCANGGYAVDLADLVKPPSASPHGFISPDLKSNGVLKSGYIITLEKEASSAVADVGTASDTCNSSANNPVSSYVANAAPVKAAARIRFFATDKRGTIFQDMAALGNPIPAGKTPVQ